MAVMGIGKVHATLEQQAKPASSKCCPNRSIKSPRS